MRDVSPFDISTLSYLMGLLQVVGLWSTWLARRSIGSQHQTASQVMFVAALAAVGLTTIYSLLVGGGWLFSGTTLSLMVVAGTCEFRSAQVPSSV